MGVHRRDFIKLLGFTGTIVALGGLTPPLIKLVSPRFPKPASTEYPRSKLVWEDGSPVKASELEINNAYVFEYPMKGIFSILINVGDENGNPIRIPPLQVPLLMQSLQEEPETPTQESIQDLTTAGRGGFYEIPGGVGPFQSIIAYNGVCQHFACQYPQLTYIPPGEKPPQELPEATRGSVLFCKCHGSVYDPYRGAAVLRGPAQRPLPTIILEWSQDTDELYAAGLAGNTIAGKFCNTCGELVGDKVIVRPATTA